MKFYQKKKLFSIFRDFRKFEKQPQKRGGFLVAHRGEPIKKLNILFKANGIFLYNLLIPNNIFI
ncbi:hypothetical protein BTO18_11745 [Polaribacter porphyrae]|uniref:Uncharacterized protein n=1 Tax=Polaribacter porphyrae TaxID=1137780 RepID=A0A2S7WQB4_9FLAO|nr:hypothetical protein BTO18_11745 [Polaribacter porphyrae]